MTTPAIATAKSAHPLAPAVLRQLGGGKDAITDAISAAEHGADAGWSGFTYYTDTIAFAKRNRRAIAEMVEAIAGDIGENPLDMVAGFRCLKDTAPSQADIAAALWGGVWAAEDNEARDMVLNALAWFALEEVGRAIADAR